MFAFSLSRRLVSTLDPAEIETFSKFDWWTNDRHMLHRYGDTRIKFVKKHLNILDTKGFSNMKILDVGCGGGILAERFCRMGGNVLGIDATERAIEDAQAH